MDIRTINWPDERPAIMEHIRVVHGPGDLDLLGRWYGTMPNFDPSDCFVIGGENGEIAAHLMLIPRTLQFGSSLLPASEIGVVGTLATHRGLGYARALMDHAIEQMNTRGDAVSVIFGIPNFYEKWGYEYAVGLYLTSYESGIATELALKANQWNMAHSHQRRMASWLGIRGQSISVRPFSINDLPAVMALYQQESAKGHYIFARDETMWRWQLNYMMDIGRYDNESFLIAEDAEDNGAILGYVRLVTNAPVNWFRTEDAARFSIIESAGDNPDATEALLYEAAAMARDFDADRIGLFVPPQSRLMEHAMARGAAQRSFTGAGFLRLNDLAQVLEQMHNTFQSRLSASPFGAWDIQLRVMSETSGAQITLGTEGGKPEVIDLESPATDLIRLFSGWFGVGNLAAGSYSLRQEDVLMVLFPKGDPKIGLADLL